MSPIFRRYTRKVSPGRRQRTYAIVAVSNIQSGKKRRSFPAMPVELGYLNLADVQKMDLSSVQDSLEMSKGTQAEVTKIVGFVQVKPRSQRAGIKFPKKKVARKVYARKNNRRIGRRGVR